MIETIITLRFSSTKREFSENFLTKENFKNFLTTMTESEKIEFSEYLTKMKNFQSHLFVDFYSIEKVNKDNLDSFKKTLSILEEEDLKHLNEQKFGVEKNRDNVTVLNWENTEIFSFFIKTNAFTHDSVLEQIPYLRRINLDESDVLIIMLESIFNKEQDEIKDILKSFNENNKFISFKDLVKSNIDNKNVSQYLFNKSEDFIKKILENLSFVKNNDYFNITNRNNDSLNITNSNKPELLKYLCDTTYKNLLTEHRNLMPPLVNSALSSIYFYGKDIKEVNENSNHILSLVQIEDLKFVYNSIINNEEFKNVFYNTLLQNKSAYKKEFNYKHEQIKFNSLVKYFNEYVSWKELCEFVKNNFIIYKKIFDNEIDVMSKKYNSGDFDIYEMTNQDPEKDSKVELLNILKLYASLYFEILLKQDKSHEIFKVLTDTYSSELSIKKIKDLKLEEELGYLFYKYENEKNINTLKINHNTGYNFIDKIFICYEKSKMNAVIQNDEVIKPKKKRI